MQRTEFLMEILNKQDHGTDAVFGKKNCIRCILALLAEDKPQLNQQLQRSSSPVKAKQPVNSRVCTWESRAVLGSMAFCYIAFWKTKETRHKNDIAYYEPVLRSLSQIFSSKMLGRASPGNLFQSHKAPAHSPLQTREILWRVSRGNHQASHLWT